MVFVKSRPRPISGVVDNHAALRTFNVASIAGDDITVLGHTAAGDIGGGTFRDVGTGFVAADDDDDMTVVVNPTTGRGFRRIDPATGTLWQQGRPVYSDWYNVLSDGTDQTSKMSHIASWHPQSDIILTAHDHDHEYSMSWDCNRDPDRVRQEARLPSLGGINKDVWEYQLHLYTTSIGRGESWGAYAIVTIFDGGTNRYAIRASRRNHLVTPVQNVWTEGYIAGIDFRGDTEAPQTDGQPVLHFLNTGHWTQVRNCRFSFCDVGVKHEGAFELSYYMTNFGDRNSQLCNVGLWEVASQPLGEIGYNYAGHTQLEKCGVSTDICGLLLDNELNTNPANGGLYTNVDWEGQKGLSIYARHTGFAWNPTLLTSSYEEKQNEAGATVDLQPYGVTSTEPGGTFTIPATYAYLFSGDSHIEFRALSQGLMLRTNPNAHASTEYNGPVVRVGWDAYNGEHDVDEHSILEVDTRVPRQGSHGSLSNHPARRVFTSKAAADIHAGVRAVKHFNNECDTVVNNFKSLTNTTKFVPTGSASVASTTGSPVNDFAARLTITPGDAVHIQGEQGGINYISSPDAQTKYSAFTFWIVAGPGSTFPLSVALRNSRRGGDFVPEIILDDGIERSYMVVDDRKNGGSYYYSLYNTGGSTIVVDVGDVQHVTDTRRDLIQAHLDAYHYATQV